MMYAPEEKIAEKKAIASLLEALMKSSPAPSEKEEEEEAVPPPPSSEEVEEEVYDELEDEEEEAEEVDDLALQEMIRDFMNSQEENPLAERSTARPRGGGKAVAIEITKMSGGEKPGKKGKKRRKKY